MASETTSLLHAVAEILQLEVGIPVQLFFIMFVPQHQCDSLEALKLFSLDDVAEAAVAVLWEVPGTVMVKMFMGV